MPKTLEELAAERGVDVEQPIDEIEVYGNFSNVQSSALKAYREELQQASREAKGMILLGEYICIAIKEDTGIFAGMATPSADIAALADIAAAKAVTPEQLHPLLPFIQKELQESPEYENVKLLDVMQASFDEDGNQIGSAWGDLIERAKKQKEAFNASFGNPKDMPDDAIRAAIFDAAIDLIVGKAQQIPVPASGQGIKVLRGIIPKNFIMPNSAVMNHLQQTGAINAGPHEVVTAGARGKRKEITVILQVECNPSTAGIELETPYLTEYDRQGINAVCTLYRYGDPDHVFTPDEVYRTMTGQDSDGKAPIEQRNKIISLFRRMDATYITIDFSQEAAKRKYIGANGKPVKSIYIRERFFQAREIAVNAGGEIAIGWQFLEAPLILRYSELSGQIISVSSSLLDIKETRNGKVTDIDVPDNTDRISVKGNLLRRISVLKYRKRNKQEWSDVISFDSVFYDTDLQQMSRDRRSDMYAYIRKCLDFWIAKEFISGYVVEKSGRKITGVKITP